MKLNELRPPEGSKKKKKRVGRGEASGLGKTSGRGSKGQNSRSGGGVKPGFEGGQMPLQRRLPKRGFNNVFAAQVVAVNLRDLKAFGDGDVVDEAALRAKGLVKGSCDQVKLLGDGELGAKLTIKLNRISKSAREKVEAAGGSVELI